MKTVFAAAAIAAALAGAASAQTRTTGPSITLYDLPNFQGPSRSFSSGINNLADQGYNDRAQSARVQGRWRVCEDAGLRGRCVDLSGDVPNLADLRITAAISSFEDLNRGQPGLPPGGGFDNRGGPNGGGFDNRDNRGGFDNRDNRGGFDNRDDRSQFDNRGGPNGGLNGGGFAGQSLDGRSASFFPRPQPGAYRGALDFCRRLGFAGVIYADDRGNQLRDVLCRR